MLNSKKCLKKKVLVEKKNFTHLQLVSGSLLGTNIYKWFDDKTDIAKKLFVSCFRVKLTGR